MNKILKVPDLGLLPKRVEALDVIIDNVKKLKQTAVSQRDHAEQDRYKIATDSEYWFCVCFETRQQKEEFLAKAGLTHLGNKHLNGLLLAEAVGVKLESASPQWPVTKRLSEFGETLKKP